MSVTTFEVQAGANTISGGCTPWHPRGCFLSLYFIWSVTFAAPLYFRTLWRYRNCIIIIITTNFAGDFDWLVSAELSIPVQHTEDTALPAARASAGTEQFQVRTFDFSYTLLGKL